MPHTVLFSIPFQAAMSSEQVDWLREELGLTFHSKPSNDPNFPAAFGSLDRFNGLFLIKDGDDGWILECRAYGQPTAAQAAELEARARWVVEALPPAS